MVHAYASRHHEDTKNSPLPAQTAGSEPGLAALKAGAMPSREQMGHRMDLHEAIRAKMEASFGMDFSDVQLYESQTVADAGATAMTMGNKIGFAPGQLDLISTGGQAILGHELSHIAARARGGISGRGFLNDRALEARADREGAMAAAGESIYDGPVTPISTTSSAISAAGPMQAKKPNKEEQEKEKYLAAGSEVREARQMHRMEEAAINQDPNAWQMRGESMAELFGGDDDLTQQPFAEDAQAIPVSEEDAQAVPMSEEEVKALRIRNAKYAGAGVSEERMRRRAEEQEPLSMGDDMEAMFDENDGRKQTAGPGHSLYGKPFNKIEDLLERGQQKLADMEQDKSAGKIKRGFTWLMKTGLNFITNKYHSFMRKHDRAMDDLALHRDEFEKKGLIDKIKWTINPANALALFRQSSLSYTLAPRNIANVLRGTRWDLVKISENMLKVQAQGQEYQERKREQARLQALERQRFMNRLVDEAKGYLGDSELGDARSELPLGPDLQEMFREPEDNKAEESTDSRWSQGNKAGAVTNILDIVSNKTGQDLISASNIITVAGLVPLGKIKPLHLDSLSKTAMTKVGQGLKFKQFENKVLNTKGGYGYGDMMSDVSSAVSLISNTTGLVSNVVKTSRSAKVAEKLSDRIAKKWENGINIDDGNVDARRRNRSLKQAFEMAKINQFKGKTGAITNILGMASNVLNLSGLGIPLAKVLSLVKGVFNLATGAVSDDKFKNMRKDVVNEETDLEKKIAGFKEYYKQKHYGQELDDHDAKHAVLKAMGFESGKRSEAFLTITGNRAKALADDANSTDDNRKEAREESQGIAEDMGLSKDANGRYNKNAFAQMMGMEGEDVDEEIVKKIASRMAFGG